MYLNFWVTHFGGCDRVQIKVNISVFGWDCPSPLGVGSEVHIGGSTRRHMEIYVYEQGELRVAITDLGQYLLIQWAAGN